MNRTLLLLLMFIASGCATVHHGRHQDVRVSTDPPGANVHVECGKPQPDVVTPATVRLPRRVEECSLVLTRPGFRTETVAFTSRASKWVWANFAAPAAGAAIGATRQSDQAFVDFLAGALLGGAGFAIDAMSGAMWELEPGSVERTLVPE